MILFVSYSREIGLMKSVILHLDWLSNHLWMFAVCYASSSSSSSSSIVFTAGQRPHLNIKVLTYYATLTRQVGKRFVSVCFLLAVILYCVIYCLNHLLRHPWNEEECWYSVFLIRHLMECGLKSYYYFVFFFPLLRGDLGSPSLVTSSR